MRENREGMLLENLSGARAGSRIRTENDYLRATGAHVRGRRKGRVGNCQGQARAIKRRGAVGKYARAVPVEMSQQKNGADGSKDFAEAARKSLDHREQSVSSRANEVRGSD